MYKKVIHRYFFLTKWLKNSCETQLKFLLNNGIKICVIELPVCRSKNVFFDACSRKRGPLSSVFDCLLQHSNVYSSHTRQETGDFRTKRDRVHSFLDCFA